MINKALHGDCLDLMKDIADKSIDMILCDLPYGTTQNGWDFLIDLKLMWTEYKRIIKDNKPIILTAQCPFDKILGCSNLSMLRYEWIWQKNIGTGHLNSKKMPLKKHENVLVFYEDLNKCKTKKNDDFIELRNYFLVEQQKIKMSNPEINKLLGNNMASHYFTDKSQWVLPTLSNYTKLQTTGAFNVEYCILKEQYKKEQKKIHKELADNFIYNPQGLVRKEKPTIRKGKKGNGSNYGLSDKDAIQEYQNYPDTILKFNREVGLHPTQKPVALFEYLIKTYTNEGDLVLDNCAGSGTTAIACINTDRNYILMEQEQKYFDIINKRIVEHTKQKSLF